jgi:hypothetical protein
MSAIDDSVFRRGAAAVLLLGLAGCGSTADRCILPAGTYVGHLTQSGPAVPCPNLHDRMVTIEENGTIAGAASASDGGASRTEADVDSATCGSTLTTDTGQGTGGVRTIVSTTITPQSGSISGTETIDTTDPSVPPHCSYEVTLTKS